MWKAIAYVSSGVTLAAFIAAVAAWVYRQHTVRTERIIRLAPENQRARLVRNALESFSVDPKGLSEDQKYHLLIKQLEVRHQKFGTTCTVVVIIACLGTFIVLFALWQTPQPQSKNPIDNGPALSPSLPAPKTSATPVLAIASPPLLTSERKAAAPSQTAGGTTPVDKRSATRDDVGSELRQKNLTPLLNQANNFAGVGNSSADLQALALYKKVINGLSPGGRAKLDRGLRSAAERADNDDNIEQAVKNYRSLFSIYLR